MSRGIQYMIAATIFLAGMQVMVKALPAIPVYEIILFRGIISCMLSFIFIRANQLGLRGENTFLLLQRGVVGTASLLTFFYSIQSIPLATAVTIGHLSPIFLGLLAMIFLKEKFSSIQWISLLICFAGVVIIKGFDSRITETELLVAVLSAFLAALAHFHVRMLKNEEPLVVLFYFSIVMIALTIPFCIFNWTQPDGTELTLLLLTGITSHLAQYFLTKALKAEEVSRVAWVYYVGIIIAILLGYFVYGERFNVYACAGMVLIAGGVLINLWKISSK
ncbi:MAG: DMT family transporter [Cytophagaceae bacterium]|nr:DMT family transporter [Cytophagaceae bacterium]